MNDNLRVPDFLGHIRDAIERIFRYVEQLDGEAFSRNELVQDAVIRNFEIIGEASRNLERADREFVARHPEIDFASARAMRNLVAHGYHKVDLEVVWSTVENNLGNMHGCVLEALREFPGRETP